MDPMASSDGGINESSQTAIVRTRVPSESDFDSDEDIDIILAKARRSQVATLNNSAKRKRSATPGGETESSDETRDTKRRKLAVKKREEKSQETRDVDTGFLQRRIEDRLARRYLIDQAKPRDLVKDKIKARRTGLKEDEPYRADLERLSTENLTTEQMEKPKTASDSGPNYLGRTASLTPGNRFNMAKRSSNRFTTQTVLLPAADTHGDQSVHSDLKDVSRGELLYMVGQHLKWSDIAGDEFLSYSMDPLFLVVHALNRYHEGQGGVTIQIIDRRTAKNVKGKQAAFYPALGMYKALSLPMWEGWKQPCRIKLRPRKFTQEYLSHGAVIDEDTRFQQASIKQLIGDGLYEIFPAFQVPADHMRAGLYTGQVVFRTIGYLPDALTENERHIYSYTDCAQQKPFTVEFLSKVQKLTRNFMNIPIGDDPEQHEPHLHVFLSLLTFEKRTKRDPEFMRWVTSHYTSADLKDLYDDGKGGVKPGFTHVAHNLPGVMQYLDLIRDAAFAFGVPELPATSVETENSLTGEVYATQDGNSQKNAKASIEFSQVLQEQKRVKAKAVRKTKSDEKKAKAGSAAALEAPETTPSLTITPSEVSLEVAQLADVPNSEGQHENGDQELARGGLLLGESVHEEHADDEALKTLMTWRYQYKTQLGK